MNLINIKITDILKHVMDSQLYKKLEAFYLKYSLIIDISAIMIYKILFDIVYIIGISPIYAYSGFIVDFSGIKYLTSLLTVLLFSIPMVGLYKQKQPSSIIVLLISLIYFIPITSLYACMNLDTVFFLSCMVYWGILMFFQYKLPTLYIKKNISEATSKKIWYLMLLIISLTVIAISGIYTGFRITIDIFDVYDTRAEATAYNIPTIFSYVLSFSGIVIPILFLYTLKMKKYLISLFLIPIFVLNFSIATHKSMFFIFFLAIIGYVFYRENLVKLFPWALSALAFISLFFQYAFNMSAMTSYLFRRSMAVPAYLSNQFYEFMLSNELNIFRNGILTRFRFNEAYDYPVPYIIGEYSDGKLFSANNGLVGDGLMNIGFISILIMPLIIAIIFRLLDSVCKGVDARVYVSMCAYYAISFANSSWSTVLLTHGFLITCFLMYFFPSTQKEISNEKQIYGNRF